MSAPTAPTYALVDHHGDPVDETDFRGRYSLVFFGFTNCRMVCPRALERLSAALEQLGELADHVQPLYISLDPDRDSPDVMRTFLAERAPRFTGLTGSTEQVEEAKAAFGVFSRRRVNPENPEEYDVPHTALTYVLDPSGRYVTHLGEALEAPEISERLRLLLRTDSRLGSASRQGLEPRHTRTTHCVARATGGDELTEEPLDRRQDQ